MHPAPLPRAGLPRWGDGVHHTWAKGGWTMTGFGFRGYRTRDHKQFAPIVYLLSIPKRARARADYYAGQRFGVLGSVGYWAKELRRREASYRRSLRRGGERRRRAR